jgi:RinA family phage transcriptional activator
MKLYIKNYIIGEIRNFDEIKQNLENIDKYDNSLVIYKMKKSYDAIEKMLNSLDDEEKKFFNLYFKQGYNRTGVLYRMNIELSTFYRIKNKIIGRVAEYLGLNR